MRITSHSLYHVRPRFLLLQPFVLKDGYVDVPTGPGLGIEIDEAKLAAVEYDGDWQTPELRHYDGSVADW